MVQINKILNKKNLQKNSILFGIVLLVVVLIADYLSGPIIRIPFLHIFPVVIMAILGHPVIAYFFAFFLSSSRVYFAFLWPGPDVLYVEIINSFLGLAELSLYAFVFSKAQRMGNLINLQRGDIEHFQSFTAAIGTTLKGRAVAPGIAEGTAMVFMPQLIMNSDETRINQNAVSAEQLRIDQAITDAIDDLKNFRMQLETRDAHEEIAFLDVRIAMLGDATLVQDCRRIVAEELRSAENAVITKISSMEQAFQKNEKAFMRARAADIHEISLLLLKKLKNPSKDLPHVLSSVPPGTIVVTDDLLLCDALQMDPTNIVAIVTERTGPASHVAMLARARSIPAVCDIIDATTCYTSGSTLLVDGNTGSVIMAPTAKQTARVSTYKNQTQPTSAKKMVLPCVTNDGTKISLFANIGHPDEASLVQELGLDGVGLFRSEYLFLQAAQLPDFNSQAAAYAEVSSMLNPRPVTIRTMDLGGDKIPRFYGSEIFSVLRTGVRGLAYSLNEGNLFRTQITAIIRAAQKGNVRMLFPMVKGASELCQARDIVEELMKYELSDKGLMIGAMIETPSALFDLDEIVRHADFLSIGTNDLTYSILDMDRRSHGNSLVDSFCNPSVVRAVHQIVKVAGSHGKTVCVCGEAASDPVVACLMIGLGLREFSINLFSTAQLCNVIKKMTIGQMTVMAEKALKARTEEEIREMITSVPVKSSG